MPPPWISTERVGAQWGLEKNLDEDKYDTRTQHGTQAYPMGDYRYNDRARARQLDVLMGVAPKPERRELLIAEQRPSERPRTRTEEWESDRKRAHAISEESAAVALKRDGSAWTDEDGYSKVKEPPAFRDGFNNTLRVKPPQEEHLHNGLKSMPVHAAPPSVASAFQSARSNDQIHRLAIRPEITAALGQYFMKGITTGLTGLTGRDLIGLASLFRREQGNEHLEGLGVQGLPNKAEDTPELDGARLKGEIELLLRSLETLEAPVGYKDSTGTEEAKRRSVALSRALGNAFVNLGMTLPAGPRDDPLRNDSVALEMGSRIMLSGDGGKQAPKIEEGLRKEIAIALGRAMLHIQAAASRGITFRDTAHKDRTLKLAVGKLTLQLLEATAARSGKVITKDPTRREVLANALGSAFMQMENAALRSHATDRNQKENAQITRKAAPFGPTATSALKMSVRLNKPSEIIVKRPIIGGRDAAPPTVPRYAPLRG